MSRQALALVVGVVFVLGGFGFAADGQGGDSGKTVERFKDDVVEIWPLQQYDTVQAGGRSAVAVHFKLKKGWHFYSDAETAPAGMNLKVKPLGRDYISFSEAIFPQARMYFDEFTGKKLKVFEGQFVVYVPFSVDADVPESVITSGNESGRAAIDIRIEGAVCSAVQCRMTDFGKLSMQVAISRDAAMGEARFALPETETGAAKSRWANYPVSAALSLALLAGLILNVMPCVWPVLPIIVMRILNQAGESKAKSVSLGLAFCLGIVLFFAAIAALNIVLRVGYGVVFQWGDHLRNPAVILVMTVLMVVLALFMFGVFTIGIPASVTGRAEGGKGYYGSIGMGFLAAVLSTPCSFAILAAAFAWAQTQKLALGTAAILLMGVGMAAPYAVLTSVPSLLGRLPKPGRWMELLKQGMGFLLLIIAVKLLEALPGDRRIGVLYFAIVLAFCVWMWGGWVGYGTKTARKRLVRLIAIGITIVCGAWLLAGASDELIPWQSYDKTVINDAIAKGRPVLIDFTADWCLNCKVLDKIVYSRKDIAALLERKGVLTVRGDTTQFDYPAAIALKNAYNEPGGVPINVLHIPGRAEPLKLPGIMIADKLKNALEELPDVK